MAEPTGAPPIHAADAEASSTPVQDASPPTPPRDRPAEPRGVAIEIDGRQVTARRGELLIDAAERHGVYIPRFCYHPRMKPVGMCRVCIAEVDTGRGPVLQPTCMLPVSSGMKLDTRSAVTKKAQEGVIEFLLVNHPLDCPVCDRGGECPLQDQTMAYGPGESRFVEEKRHHEKPIPISGLVLLDRERCILCDRCTRFASDVAGDPLIQFISRGAATEVNTFPDHEFASYFSGNTVQICPVGALTSTSYRFRARPWDLEVTESTCQTCSVGCRMTVESSRDEVLRTNGVDIEEVNWGWLCDRGRFNVQALGSDRRLVEPMVRDDGGELRPARWNDALAAAAVAVRAAVESAGPGAVAAIGGSRFTNEDAYAWARLLKGVVGTDHLDAQLGDGLAPEVLLGLPRADIATVCRPGGTVLVLAPDLKEELPVLFLRLRHAVESDGATLVEVSPLVTSTTALAATSLHPRPGAQAAVVAALTGAPHDPNQTGVSQSAIDEARAWIDAADELTVILGRQSLAESGDACVAAAATLHSARPGTRFLSALRRGNVHGAIDMGLAPGLLPGRVTLDEGRDRFAAAWGSVPAARGLDTIGILEKAAAGGIHTLFLLGADPLADVPDRDLAARGLAGAKVVVSLDRFLTPSSAAAHVVLPAAGFAEVDGTTTNLEGRAAPVARRVTPPGTARPPWVIAADLAHHLGDDLGVGSLQELADEARRLTGEVASPASEGSPTVAPFVVEPNFAPPPVDSYSLRLVATRRLYDEAVETRHSPALADLAPGTKLRINSYDAERLGATTGDTVRVTSSRASVEVEMAVDDRVPRGSAAMEVLQGPTRVTDLIDAGARVTELRVETLK